MTGEWMNGWMDENMRVNGWIDNKRDEFKDIILTSLSTMLFKRQRAVIL